MRSPARNLALEAAVLDAPDELDAWRVYADWLQTQGDPWGERVSLALQHHAAEGRARARLRRRLRGHDREHALTLHGEALSALRRARDFDEVARLRTRFGLIVEASVRAPEYEWSGTAPAAVLSALLASPAARLLHTLRLGLIEWSHPATLHEGVAAITAAAPLASLRALVLGDFDYPDDSELSWVELGDVSGLWTAAPGLRSVELRGHAVELGVVEHPTLESLTIETSCLPRAALASLGAARLPAARRIHVWLGAEDPAAGRDVELLAPLLEASEVPALTELGLCNCDFQDQIAIALAESRLLAQLCRVDLSMGTLHEPGAEAILANAAAFAHLDALILDENFIPEPLCARLRETLGERVSMRDQEQPNAWDDGLHYYVSVGE